MSENKKMIKRRGAIQIMKSLIGLVKPLIHIMLAAILLGTLGYLCAIFLTILAGQVIVRGLLADKSDILIKNMDDTIDIYEIKKNKELNEAIMNDLLIQYWICQKRFGDKLTSFNVILNAQNEEKWTIQILIKK